MRSMIIAMMTASILSATAAVAAESGLPEGMSNGLEADASSQATQVQLRQEGSFQGLRTRLRADGFHGIRMIDGDPYRLYAFDTEGSPVRLLITSQPHGDYEMIYIHQMDE